MLSRVSCRSLGRTACAAIRRGPLPAAAGAAGSAPPTARALSSALMPQARRRVALADSNALFCAADSHPELDIAAKRRNPGSGALRFNSVVAGVLGDEEIAEVLQEPIPVEPLPLKTTMTPRLVVDLAVVRENFRTLASAFDRETEVLYAVKANPEPAVLRELADLGSSFDCASLGEIEMVLAIPCSRPSAVDGFVSPARISFGNTVKKEADIAAAYRRGIRMFAADCVPEVEKIARVAPGSLVYCRLLLDNPQGDAKWPLSRKFGCSPEMGVHVLKHAQSLGLEPQGVSFHVGSQQVDVTAWDVPIELAVGVIRAVGLDKVAREGGRMPLLNLGGGFPTVYTEKVPNMAEYAKAIYAAVDRHTINAPVDPFAAATGVEPGRSMVGSAGFMETSVVLISNKTMDPNGLRWVYLDAGRFNGLAETQDEAIRYRIRTRRDRVNGRAADRVPCVVAGPTCDSVDVMYEKNPYWLPKSLEIGDVVRFDSTGAYTATYSSVAFNGFDPIPTEVVDSEKEDSEAEWEPNFDIHPDEAREFPHRELEEEGQQQQQQQ